MQTHISTEALAQSLGIKPQTLRAALCRNGHYYGLRPIKLPSRLLLWPGDALERLTAGKGPAPQGWQAPHARGTK